MTGPAEPAAPPRQIPARIAALTGVLGIGAAVAAGHLAAGFLGGDASPFRAVANEVRDKSPDAVVEWAKQTLGTSDKLVAQARRRRGAAAARRARRTAVPAGGRARAP